MNESKFDELELFAKIKRRPGMYFGTKSILFLHIFLSGVICGTFLAGQDYEFHYFHGFNDWYMNKKNVTDKNGYVIWWNHILYTSGNYDSEAFDIFFKYFEEYLLEQYNITLPEVK